MSEPLIPGTIEVPHITVNVEYKGESVQLQTQEFIDGITFLCDVERALRYGKNLPNGKTVDKDTLEAIAHNRELLFHPQKRPIDV